MSCRPNRATGTRAQIIAQEETCWGEVATGQQALGVEFTSETLRDEINAIESQLIRSDRMRSPGQQGNRRPGGDINGELQPNGIWPLLIHHCLGGSVSTTGSGPYVHELEGSIDLPEGLSFEKRFGYPDGTFQRLRYLGGKVNEFGLTVPTEGIVTCRAGLLFKSESEPDPNEDMDASPLFPDDNEPFNSFHGSILMDLDGDENRVTVAHITTIDMLISNSMDGDQFAIDGSQFRADIPEDLRIINGNLTAFFTDEMWKIYQRYKDNVSIGIELLLQRNSRSWHFTIPKVKIRGNATPQVGGRGPMNIQAQYEAHRDDDLQTDILLTITNDDPAISTAV